MPRFMLDYSALFLLVCFINKQSISSFKKDLQNVGFPDKHLLIPSPQYWTPLNTKTTPVLSNPSNLPAVYHCRTLCFADLQAF